MQLLEQMIKTRRFSEFVNRFISIYRDEQEDSALWDFWLHRVFDKSYSEFINSIKTNSNKKLTPSKKNIEATVRDSMFMLDGFVPSGEGVAHGTISSSGNNSD